MARARFLVVGMVQGVGYRWFVRRAALRLGLCGYAENLPDGRVEVVVEGEAASIEELSLELKRGPSLAQVDRVEKHNLPHEVSVPKNFETR